jgi:hypothetical protein
MAAHFELERHHQAAGGQFIFDQKARQNCHSDSGNRGLYDQGDVLEPWPFSAVAPAVCQPPSATRSGASYGRGTGMLSTPMRSAEIDRLSGAMPGALRQL